MSETKVTKDDVLEAAMAVANLSEKARKANQVAIVRILAAAGTALTEAMIQAYEDAQT